MFDHKINFLLIHFFCELRNAKNAIRSVLVTVLSLNPYKVLSNANLLQIFSVVLQTQCIFHSFGCTGVVSYVTLRNSHICYVTYMSFCSCNLHLIDAHHFCSQIKPHYPSRNVSKTLWLHQTCLKQ